MRLWPKSLLGQVLLSVMLALLVAQSISAVLLYRAAENRRSDGMIQTAAFRLAVEDTQLSNRERRQIARERRRAGGPAPRALRIERLSDFALEANEARIPDAEQELRSLLASRGVAVAEIIVTERLAREDPFITQNPRLMRRLDRPRWRDGRILLVGLRREGDPLWSIARVPRPPGQRNALGTIVLQTLLIFAVLGTLLYFLLRRITRPLGQLTARTEKFARNQQASEPLTPSGPDDIQRLVTAHNSMELRITALLDEKDVMLGAIGHDLKTPLAALRVRIESVEDEAERAKMAASIEDITLSLDDILSLARIGRAGSPAERTNLAALVAGVVEEFEDMGKPVSLAESERIALPIHVTWLRRALRNLIDNALRYGSVARVSLHTGNDLTILRVEDDGPGIPEDRIADMLEPFQRGEASRNRATGGAGLGFTLTRAIAEQHGGELLLANCEGGGLRAEIRLPAD